MFNSHQEKNSTDKKLQEKNSTEALFWNVHQNSMKYHSKSVFDYPFSFQGVYLLIKYANFDSTVQREGFCVYTVIKLAQQA